MRKMKAPPRKTYQFRLSDSEIAALDAKAASAGLDRSKYLRQAIAGSTVLNRHVAQQQSFLLGSIANNLNQIARVANTHKEGADTPALLQQLRQTDALIRQAFDLGAPPLLRPAP